MPLNFNLFLIGDDHEGSLLRDCQGWTKMCDMVLSSYKSVKKNHNYVIHHGDFIEAILIDDYRFDLLTTKEAFIIHQLSEAKKNFWPIRNNLMVLLDGNHTDKLRKFGEITKYFCEAYLDKPEAYGTWSCHITYHTAKNEVLFKHFCTHGAGSINSYAGDTEQKLANVKVLLKRRLANKFGDTLLNSMGHTHKLIVCAPLGSIPDKKPLFLKASKDKKVEKKITRVEKTDGYIHPDFKWYCNTGSFLNLYLEESVEGQEVSGYAEKANYDPIETGFIVVCVRDGKISEVDIIKT